MSAAALTLDAVRRIVARHKTTISEEDLQQAEAFILGYGKKLATEKDIAGLEELMVAARSSYQVMGRVKAAKLIRKLVELCLSIDQSPSQKISLVEKCIQWASDNHHVFLKRTLDACMVRLLHDQGKYIEALKAAGKLVVELKKLEDRELLLEVSLEESRNAFALKNFAKAKTSLVLAKTSSNGVYVSTAMQAAIDLQSGILYLTDEQDFKTAYSYCYEALEGFQIAGDMVNAIRVLKYMCLCKIMTNESEQVQQLLATKVCSSIKGKDINAIVEMAAAFNKRCLQSFQECMNTYKKELMEDPVVRTHLGHLHNNMLEKEISRVLEPYSEVELSHIVKKVNLPKESIGKVISTMLLDKKIYGFIDQQNSILKIFTPPSTDIAYQKANDLILALSHTVDAVYARAALIN